MRELIFRGYKKTRNYFEGWYFKFVDESHDLILILIPGIAKFREDMAFVQYILHYKGMVKSGCLRYALDAFEIGTPFHLKFEHGFISKDTVEIRIDDIDIKLQLKAFTPLKTSLFNPSIMGFFEYLPMPCFHDVISMNHEVVGEVKIQSEMISFAGKGYIEADRGKSFPKYYLWAQCNHFKKSNASLFLSVADISTKFFKFLGHIAVFYYEGKEYRFASYLGSKVTVEVSKDKQNASVCFSNRNHILRCHIELKEGNTLIAPMYDKMDFKIKEQVKSYIQIEFDDYQDESSFCASELVNWKG